MKILNVNIPQSNYDIVIEKGLLKNFGKEIKKVYNNTNIAVITDHNAYNLYGQELKKSLEQENYNSKFIIVEPGEISKSMSTLELVYSELSAFGITRSDLITAFGGGVVGDLAGFAASTYLRGINYIQIPTTLLAQVDSSVGGKVAINLKEGKNLAGSFYHPLKVLIDPDFLLSLPEKYFKDGLGEVIKYACIMDPVLYKQLLDFNKEQLLDYIEQLIYTCCNIKKNLVEKDVLDTNQRMLLNFGHTIGHAIEKSTNYEVSHGEAVSQGMLLITRTSEKLNLTEKGTYEKIKMILDHYNINYHRNIDSKTIKNYVLMDKKNLSEKLNLILLKKIGEAFIYKVPIDEVEKFIFL